MAFPARAISGTSGAFIGLLDIASRLKITRAVRVRGAARFVKGVGGGEGGGLARGETEDDAVSVVRGREVNGESPVPAARARVRVHS